MGKLADKVTAIAAGEAHTLALTGDGSVFSWGRGTFGRLGTGRDDDELFPVPVEFGDGDTAASSSSSSPVNPKFAGIAAGAYHSLALQDLSLHLRMRATYVVFVGRRPGLYYDWHQCSLQVNGYKGAIFKRFNTYADAEMAFMDFWGYSYVSDGSSRVPNQYIGTNRSASSSPQSSTHHAPPVPNDGGTSDVSHTKLENIIVLLAIICLILSVKILFG